MSVLVPVVHIRPAMVVKVLPRTFKTIAEPLLAKSVKLDWSCIPRALWSSHAPIRRANQV
jgi:hypothetical protein